MNSTYRYDTLENRWVIIARHRLKTPTLQVSDMRMEGERCPFCSGNEALSDGEIDATAKSPGRIRNSPGWINRVVANRYKAVAVETSNETEDENGFLSRGGFGAHEIVIDTPSHDSDLSLMPQKEVVDYLEILRKRLNDLRRDGRIAYISIFKNVGILAGEMLRHPHTQILAYPVIPSHVEQIHRREEQYYEQHRRHLLLDDVAANIEFNERVVWTEGDFCLYAPYASHNPFELRIVPRCVMASIADASTAQMADLATVLHRTIGLLKALLGDKIAYNIVFRDAVSNHPLSEGHHTFYIMIIPRLFGMGAAENEDRMYINTMPPEEAASLYKERL